MSMRPKTLLENAYTTTGVVKNLWSMIESDRWRFLFMLLLNVVKASPVWVLPVVTANVINIITYQDRHELWELWANAAVMLAFFLQNLYTHTVFMNMLSKILRNMEVNLRSALIRRLQHLSIAFLDAAQSGRLQSKVLRDVENVQMFYSQFVNIIFCGGVGIVFALAVTLHRRPVMAICYVVMVPVCVFLIKRFRQSLTRVNRHYRIHLERMSASVIEMLEMLPVTRAHGVEDAEIQRMDSRLEHVRRSGIRVDTVTAVFNAAIWVTFQVFQLSFLVLCAWLAWKGNVTVFGVTVFPGRMPIGDVVLYQSFFSMITNSVNNILNVYPVISKGVESIHSIGEVLECPDIERNAGKKAVTDVRGGFVFEAVNYTYPDALRPSVRDLSLTVKPGECVAVVGSSGSGKSTLMSLLIGFRRPTSGRILLDGSDMEILDLRQYRRYLAVVPQSTMLFSGTIRDNITYGLPDVTEAQIREAVEAANCAEFIRSLPDGLDTRLGEHGSRLSGGQKQRLSIARALVRDPQVIILDEATSALDVASERLVQEAIAHLVKGRTTFIVAHRFSTIRVADRILVMKDGVCVEGGTMDELLARRGEFYRLHQLQG